jgi:hypothetical protein
MKNIFLLFGIALFSNNVISQSIFRSNEYGFEMQSPNNWKQANNSMLRDNLEKFEVNEENLQKILRTNRGSILLSSFYKYDPKTHSGLIPTIQINVRLKPDVDFEQFKMLMIQSAKGFSTVFSDFTYITAPSEIEISGVKSIYFVGKFTMKTQNGQEMKVRSRTYAIPNKNYFYQLNFTDGQTEEDCNEEFDALIQTIKVNTVK